MFSWRDKKNMFSWRDKKNIGPFQLEKKCLLRLWVLIRIASMKTDIYGSKKYQDILLMANMEGLFLFGAIQLEVGQCTVVAS